MMNPKTAILLPSFAQNPQTQTAFWFARELTRQGWPTEIFLLNTKAQPAQAVPEGVPVIELGVSSPHLLLPGTGHTRAAIKLTHYLSAQGFSRVFSAGRTAHAIALFSHTLGRGKHDTYLLFDTPPPYWTLLSKPLRAAATACVLTTPTSSYTETRFLKLLHTPSAPGSPLHMHPQWVAK